MSSSTRLLVLGCVRIFQPVHGYDVRRELLSWRAGEWANVAPGSIYNALKSMTRDGLLEVVGTDQVGGRPERTSYRLTTEGEKEFQSLLRDTWWRVEAPLDPLMPGIVLLWAMPRTEAIAALKHRIAHSEGVRTSRQFVIDQYKDPMSEMQVKEMLRLMIARLDGEIAWARTLLARLEAGEYELAGEAGALATGGPRAGAAEPVPKVASGARAVARSSSKAGRSAPPAKPRAGGGRAGGPKRRA
ncbi:MAG: helix-turn-helix transcriptional regulator [Deltaproteobacteria bacterium]|nr:helix-turn-helix transcriptional regulator [Deltaproteobacteria bacterium]